MLPGHTSTVRAVVMLPCTCGIRARSGTDSTSNYGAAPHVLLTASRDGTLRTFDLRVGRARAVLAGHSGAVRCIDADLDVQGGVRCVSGGADGAVRVSTRLVERERETDHDLGLGAARASPKWSSGYISTVENAPWPPQPDIRSRILWRARNHRERWRGYDDPSMGCRERVRGKRSTLSRFAQSSFFCLEPASHYFRDTRPSYASCHFLRPRHSLALRKARTFTRCSLRREALKDV